MKLPIFQIDAFTDKLFSGNPAAVIVLKDWIDDALMQQIALENNLAETAFIVPSDNHHEIRWFTPMSEVDLCGHATIASAYVLFNEYRIQSEVIEFKSLRSGALRVKRIDNLYELDFPLDEIKVSSDPLPVDVFLGLGAEPKEIYKGKTDMLLVFDTQEQIENLSLDYNYLKKAEGRGIIVSAPGNDVDFVSRFFAPQIGINEDPVTGSAHTTLLPYWHKKLGKSNFIARQLSNRGGFLHCKIEDNRAKIGGAAVIYMRGEITF